MSKKMCICLSEEATKIYFSAAKEKISHEVEEGCLPSGIQLIVNIVPPFGTTVTLENGEIVEASVEFSDV